VWADEATPHVLHSMSLGQLATHSAHVAAALRSMGLKPGAVHTLHCSRTRKCFVVF
jgi:acyl-coenzyme A synthetase/AMP-(fatty) acid ligase